MKRVSLILVVAFLVTSCAHARHAAVLADLTFAQAVFAVDDAQFTACKTNVPPFTVEVCASTNLKIKAALIDVKAVTAALQATPKDGTVPETLPDLLKSLSDIQAMLSPLAPSLVKADVAVKVQTALTKAIAVVSAFAGAQ